MVFRKMLVSWIIASVVMFSLSYLWHGVILNDFNRLQYPKNVYLIASLIAYMVIGFIVARSYYLDFLHRFEKKPLLKGLSSGALAGAFIYLIAFVVGISFGGRKLEYIIMDLAWQIVEQAIGGLTVGFAHVYMHNTGLFLSEEE